MEVFPLSHQLNYRQNSTTLTLEIKYTCEKVFINKQQNKLNKLTFQNLISDKNEIVSLNTQNGVII